MTAASSPVVTPLVRFRTAAWGDVLLKNETAQLSGSFKYRGSFAVASTLPKELG